MANPSASAYNADAIEVLSGLDPVRKRPGMYTDTSRPNHLAQEVIDNSVDEALAGHARSVQVILHADHSLEVSDDGRGMPVDIHPEEGVSGVELILTKLHAGGKFSNKLAARLISPMAAAQKERSAKTAGMWTCRRRAIAGLL